MMLKKIFIASMVSIAVPVTVFPAMFVYWLNESPPIRYSNRSVMTPTVKPGEVLKVRISAELDLSKKCIATVNRSIVDSQGTTFDKKPVRRPPYTNYVVEFPIPLGAAPGIAHYQARTEWECNPVQQFIPYTVLQPELEFRIEPTIEQRKLFEQQGILGFTKRYRAVGEM